jgi:uncharacterized membrane protein (UPF0127 family)
MEARRLRSLPRATVLGHQVRVASVLPARLLGLALLDRRRSGPGLLIPRCRSVHTVGMRFRIDVLFLDSDGSVLRELLGVPPFRFLRCSSAVAVLELPARGSTGSRSGVDRTP